MGHWAIESRLATSDGIAVLIEHEIMLISDIEMRPAIYLKVRAISEVLV